MEEEHAKAFANEVEARCQRRLSDCQDQHAEDMLQLEKRKQELLILVDQQVCPLMNMNEKTCLVGLALELSTLVQTRLLVLLFQTVLVLLKYND